MGAVIRLKRTYSTGSPPYSRCQTTGRDKVFWVLVEVVLFFRAD